ncbi:MAG: cytochrome C oxidase subunit IV family protein [Chloroflexi bacterium]|nr:cytochrome C oxidase subunit IV family protein [Chloroflexota bacterium]
MVTEPHEHAHPGPRQYVAVGVILAIITAVEVATFYLHIPLLILIPVLLALAAVKFSLVVMFFMHLKFDPRLFTWLFLFGLVLAGALLTAMLVRPISAM